MNILLEANDIINGDRNDDYGHPAESFEKIALGWSQILDCTVTAREIPLMMIWLKLVRQTYKPQRDNMLDIAGYVGTYEMVDSVPTDGSEPVPHRKTFDEFKRNMTKNIWKDVARSINKKGASYTAESDEHLNEGDRDNG